MSLRSLSSDQLLEQLVFAADLRAQAIADGDKDLANAVFLVEEGLDREFQYRCETCTDYALEASEGPEPVPAGDDCPF